MAVAFAEVAETLAGSPFKPGSYVVIRTLSDGVILHCGIWACGKVAYTVSMGSALCWEHYQGHRPNEEG